MKELNIIKNVCQNSFWGRTWSYKGEVKKSYNKLNRNRHLKKFIYRDDGVFNINDDLII